MDDKKLTKTLLPCCLSSLLVTSVAVILGTRREMQT